MISNRIVDELLASQPTSQPVVEEGVAEEESALSIVERQSRKIVKEVKKVVVKRPAIAVGAALTLGLAIGWWVKRK